uniref:Uncharacterized protein n=1 Tax=Glossina palpalis gambiensis TaxID=67801 RepID=A0A1B0B5B3_9MUSC
MKNVSRAFVDVTIEMKELILFYIPVVAIKMLHSPRAYIIKNLNSSAPPRLLGLVSETFAYLFAYDSLLWIKELSIKVNLRFSVST